MHITRAYAERETLSDNDLERLAKWLKDDTNRYREAIRGYSPEKMARFGAPFLKKLEAKEVEVQRLRAERRSKSEGAQ